MNWVWRLIIALVLGFVALVVLMSKPTRPDSPLSREAVELYRRYADLPEPRMADCVETLRRAIAARVRELPATELWPQVDAIMHQDGCFDRWSMVEPVQSASADTDVASGTVGAVSANGSIERFGDVAVVRLKKFDDQALRDIRAAVKHVKTGSERTPHTVVLNLAYNPGGLLSVQASILDLLFSPEPDRVFMRLTGKASPPAYKTSQKGVFREKKVIVVMNGLSESASEFMAGVLRYDWYPRTTVLVGRRSAGKPVVQSNDSRGRVQMRVTSGRWDAPLGLHIEIHGEEPTGLEPDVPLVWEMCGPEDSSCLIRVLEMRGLL